MDLCISQSSPGPRPILVGPVESPGRPLVIAAPFELGTGNLADLGYRAERYVRLLQVVPAHDSSGRWNPAVVLVHGRVRDLFTAAIAIGEPPARIPPGRLGVCEVA